MTLVGPGGPEPRISVVMVTRGAWSLTKQALSALRAHTDHLYELIVVDNDSRDQTRARLSELDYLQVLVNDENVGFGPACNQGAAVARGEFLLLLNTDAFVRPGWLEPMLDALNEPSVGAVVPRYLHPDGSLQEAGNLLAKDGTVLVYGDGDDPRWPAHRFRRVVDAGSAACMLIRRHVFEQVGGFDPSYAPAYYDDTDLCMRLAELGMAVMYQPRATVTHIRYGSGGVENAIELSDRNRARFRERWGPKLAGRPWTLAGSSEQATIAARDALATPRVLLLTVPDEPAAAELTRALLDSWPRARVTWASDAQLADAEPWLAMGVEVLEGFEWLEERLFHYDIVLLAEPPGADLAAVLLHSQPQAPQVPIAEVADLAQTMAFAGIAPP